MMIHKYTTQEIIEQKGNLEKLLGSPKNEVYVILDNIRSAYNVGQIFRTCDAFRVKKLFLCGITAQPPRPDIEKTALKTIDWVDWEYIKVTEDIVKKLKAKNVTIVGVEQTDKSVNLRDFKFEKPIALIFGHERDGIADEVLGLCDGVVQIPMQGIANSINVATMAGIALFEVTKK